MNDLNRMKKLAGILNEGYTVVPNIDKDRYTDLSYQGLEGPFRLSSGKVVYYDPREGKYYDRDTDMYMSNDDYDAHNTSNLSGVPTIGEGLYRSHSSNQRSGLTLDELVAMTDEDLEERYLSGQIDQDAYEEALAAKSALEVDEARLSSDALAKLRSVKDQISPPQSPAPKTGQVAQTLSPEEQNNIASWEYDVAQRFARDMPSVARKREASLTAPMAKPEIQGPAKGFYMLKGEGEVLDELIKVKGKVEELAQKAEDKWGPLPPGLKADLDDSYFDEKDHAGLLEKNKEALANLMKYIQMKKSVYKKKSVREDEVTLGEKSKSEKQARFMAAAAHDPKFAKRVGIKQSVAKEFNKADTGTEQLSKAMKKENVNESSDLLRMKKLAGMLTESVNVNDGQFQDLVLNAIAALYGESIWDNDAMQDLAHDLESQNPTEQELNHIIDTGLLPPRLQGTKFSAGDNVRFGGIDENLGGLGLGEDHVPQFTNDAETDARVYSMIQGMSGLVDNVDEVLAKISGYLLDQGLDNDEVLSVMPRIESYLHDVESAGQSPEMNNMELQEPGTEEYYQDDDEYFEETYDLENGYGEEECADGDDYFPDGADSPVTRDVGPSGARQGDNPEQKRMEVAETHKELVYAYRNFLKESKK